MMYHEGRASRWRSSATRAFPHESCEFGQLTVNSPAPRLTHALKLSVESMEPIRLISPTSVLYGFYPQVLSVRYSSLDNLPNLDTGMHSVWLSLYELYRLLGPSVSRKSASGPQRYLALGITTLRRGLLFRCRLPSCVVTARARRTFGPRVTSSRKRTLSHTQGVRVSNPDLHDVSRWPSEVGGGESLSVAPKRAKRLVREMKKLKPAAGQR